jgi:DNA-directed RNA polymerase specialized sigma24 family protein
VVNELDGGSVMEALQDVDEMYRAPLTLFYLEQLSYKEIAGLLGVPIGTVMSRLSRGKEQLKRQLTAKAHRVRRKIITFEKELEKEEGGNRKDEVGHG